MNKEEIIKALNWRYATQVFDSEKKISEQDIHTILESGRLAPSAMGVETWKFILVKDPEMRAKLREAGFNQPKITEASHLIVIAYRTDGENIIKERLERTAKIQNQDMSELGGLRSMLEGSIPPKVANGTFEAWSKSMTFIPLGMMIETASLLGIDNGPMEGFNPEKVDELLNLKAKNLKSGTMLALGYRGEDPASLRPKVRRNFEDAVEVI